MAKKKDEEPKEKPASLKKESREPKIQAPSYEDRIGALISDVTKKMRGRANLMRASEYRLPYLYKRLPTGLLSLDVALGGGWPAGGLSHVIGRRSAGKSYLVWATIRQLQAILGDKMRVLLAMTEIPADRSQARKAGVQISMGDEDIMERNRARISKGWPPLSKEEIAELKHEVGTIHELHAMAAEDFFDIILRAIDENMYNLIVIDSIGNILAAAEQENESVHDKVYGGTSGPNTTFLKKMTNMLTMRTEYGEVRDSCIIGVNQIRDDIKNPNKNYRAPGGNSLEHAKLVDVYLESGPGIPVQGAKIRTPEGLKPDYTPYAKNVKWRIEKGKAGIHEGAYGVYLYDFRTNSADYYTDTIITGLTHGIIEGSGAWLTVLGPNGEQILRANGQERLYDALAADAAAKANTDDLSVMDYIRDAVFRKNNIDISYDWEDMK